MPSDFKIALAGRRGRDSKELAKRLSKKLKAANTEKANGFVIIAITHEPSVPDKIELRNNMMDAFKEKFGITAYTMESFDKWGKYKGQGITVINENNDTIKCFTTTGETTCMLILEVTTEPNTEYDRKGLKIVKDSFNIK